MGNENDIESHFIFHDPLIFNHSRKTQGFFMGHEFKKPHENSINSDTMKKSFSIHGFFIIIKKPLKKTSLASFYFIVFSWVFCLLDFFHGP